MHKDVLKLPPMLIKRKVLRRAFRHLKALGLVYKGRRAFWTKQVPILEMYLQDRDTDEKIVRNVHRFLVEIGAIDRELPSKVVGAFPCEDLGITMYQPCQDKQCPLWGDYPSRLNCIRYFLADQNRDQLSVAEMSIMSGFSRVHINNILNSGLKNIRSHALNDLKEEHYEPKMEIVNFDGICVNCGRETNNPAGMFHSEWDSGRKYTYCQFTCFATKPPTQVFLEQSLGVSIEEVLNSLPKRYEDPAEAASCLTIDEPALVHLLWTRTPNHPYLQGATRPNAETRQSGRKTWERESRKLKEKIIRLTQPIEPQVASV